jgi:hypothetical protein
MCSLSPWDHMEVLVKPDPGTAKKPNRWQNHFCPVMPCVSWPPPFPGAKLEMREACF